MDATAVAVAASISLGSVNRRQVFRFAFHFGLFQALMPVAGWAAGRRLVGYIQQWDHWIAFVLLAFVGIKAIHDACSRQEEREAIRDPTRGWSLVLLSVATSIDALAVGLTLSFLGAAIWYPCLIIGLVTGVMTTSGMLLGNRLGNRTGPRIKALGGLILLGVGFKILVEHLMV